MNNDRFDEIIRQKLSHLNVENTKDAWSMFESKKGDAMQKTISDHQFDHIVKDKILKTKPIYKPAHWQLMRERLRMAEERKNSIFISKVMEFAAIFLILVTFLHAYQVFNPKQEVNPSPSSFASVPAVSNTKIKAHHSPTTLYPETSGSVKHSLSNNTSHYNITSNSDEISNVNQITPSTTNVIPGSENTISSSIPVASILSPIRPLQSLYNQHQILAEAMLKRGSTSHILIHTLEAINPEPQSEIALSFPMKIVPDTKKPQIYLGGYISSDVNLINTPFDKLYSLASYTKEALNSSYGINLSKKINLLEIESGIGYAHREYQPKIIREEYGQFADYYFEKSLNKISFDIANIPLHLKYHIIDQSSWGAYLMVGAALNLIVNAEYDINETLRRGLPAARFTPEQARLDEKPFTSGMFNNGSFKENYFASLSFGFGIEKTIFDNTSIYIQPSYQRQVLSADIGIGPNKDKIHTSSIQFGLKTVLN